MKMVLYTVRFKQYMACVCVCVFVQLCVCLQWITGLVIANGMYVEAGDAINIVECLTKHCIN